ncbi:peptidoglycan D,D-transpeptidase FtsI family protein [Thermus scotoductus]|uniref:Dihydropteridine reductase n=3 Tax=Thermus scotoductus TaxID=37636 RepID=A0A430R5R6_THESC|nr:penicillin-binding transpeptidase domain-containing protein [Thermus scotoductus]RTH02734.1 dihydropteridine reductase [Thermus scotoductus]RTI42357.1 dihydropteridine reductase [Thermus scotoductus]
MTVGVSRVSWVFLGLALWVALFGLGLYSLIARPPRLSAPLPPAAPPRGTLYAQDGTPLAISLKEGRYYPLGKSASQLLGFGERGTGKGLEGLERDLNGALEAGRSFTLTLDPWIQAMAERALWEGLARSRGAFGALVVMDREGNLRAVANGPTFDPLAPRGDPNRDISWRNHAFLVPLEPGSTMKALTAAMLIEEGAASLTTPVEAPMQRVVDEWTIRDVIPHPSVLTLAEVLRYSSNVGISLLAEAMPKEVFYTYMEKLHLTDSRPLPGVRVANPVVSPPGTWSRAAYANHTFGQGFLITPLHLTAAFNTLVDGLYRPPRLFAQQEGQPERVFSPATARAIRQALKEGLAPRASLAGYPLAGKTGTAQVVVNGKYSKEVFTAWFAGFVPGDEPLYTVVVAVHHPKGEINGSQVAAPIFREVAAGLLAYRGVPPYAEGR